MTNFDPGMQQPISAGGFAVRWQFADRAEERRTPSVVWPELAVAQRPEGWPPGNRT